MTAKPKNALSRAALEALDRKCQAIERRIRHYHCCGDRVRIGELVHHWRDIQDRMIAIENGATR